MALLALAGCTGPQGFAPACPQLSVPSEASRFVRYAGDRRDITDLQFDAHIAAVPASCSWADKAHDRVKAELSLTIAASRGPALHASAVGLPYFVAVSEGDRIYDKQVYVDQASFGANADQTTVNTPVVSMLFPVTAAKRASAYTITVGFQLSPAQLDANRAQPQR